MPAVQWLTSGSRLEDEPTCRASHHFHNPLLPFLEAMNTDLPEPLRLFCAGQGFGRQWSNVTWGTGAVSPTLAGAVTGNPFDWAAARRRYLDGLTLGTAAEREAALADTFLTLGHLTHLVQDLAVPAHVRNDFVSHLDLFPKREPFTRWFENGFERFVRRNPELVDAAQAMPVVFDGAPPTRFWDRDVYDGTNPSADPVQGLAEYTNANFASANTIFTEDLAAGDPHRFPFPRQASTNLADLFQQRLTPARTQAEDAIVDLGLYLSKERDGERVGRFARAGYLTRDLIDNAAPELVRLSLQLDDDVHRDYASLLVPRAVGYSAALLEYFFRGRLDVDVVADGADPTIVRLTGRNGSRESLTAGTVRLYADDVNGVRVPAPSHDDVTLADVAPDAPLTSARFQVPPDTERLVAVYQGTLGGEREAPEAGAPGAVIGRVLGGVRVEQIFAEGDTWKVRTPRGVFTLPLSTAEFTTVTWGDGDDVVVARTPFGEGKPNRFVAYRVERRPGSVEFPVSGSTPLPVTRLRDAVFPFGVPSGTTVRFGETVAYRQRIARVAPVTAVSRWNGFFYELDHVDAPAPSFETAYSATLAFEEQFPIDFDTGHSPFFATVDRRYVWVVRDVTADAAGRLLALIQVTLLRPTTIGHVPFFAVDHESGAVVERGQASVPAFFPPGVNPLLWALVDVGEGRVVASTAGPEVAIVLDRALEAAPWGGGESPLPNVPVGVWARGTAVNVEGPTPSSVEFGWTPFPLSLPLEDWVPRTVTADVSSRLGQQALQVGGWKRAELETALPTSFQTTHTARRTERGYMAKSRSEVYAVGLGLEEGATVDHPARLMDARRARGDAGAPRVVFLAESRSNDESGPAHIVVWEPEAARARVAADLPVGQYRLRAVASQAALVVPDAFPAPTSTTVVRLDGSSPPVTLTGDLSKTFTVLDPGYLYNFAGDLRFYRLQEPPEPTALPARLAPASAQGGDFHTVRLP